MSCGIGCRQGTDLTFLWLWLRPVARVPIQPLTWDPPYAMDVALKNKKKKRQMTLFNDKSIHSRGGYYNH